MTDDGGVESEPVRQRRQGDGASSGESSAPAAVPASSGGSRLKAAVLLAGSTGRSRLCRATGRAVVDLPVTPDESILDYWQHELVDLALARGLASLSVRVMVDRGGLKPTLRGSEPPVTMRLEEDPYDYRGTGGLISDLARDYDDDDELLVVSGTVLPVERLVAMVDRLESVSADVAILASETGEPGGMLRLRCGAFRGIKPVGFVDLKEQALPQVAEVYDVRVVRMAGVTGRSIRTLASYVEELRSFTSRKLGERGGWGPWREDWRPTFGLVETGAEVDDTAVIHDSVVLRGARVGKGAAVVRSIVSSGSAVPAKTAVVDRVVGEAGRRREERRVEGEPGVGVTRTEEAA